MKTLKEFFVAAIIFGIGAVGCGGSPVQDLKAVAPAQAELQSLIANEAMAGTCSAEDYLNSKATEYKPMISVAGNDSGTWGNDGSNSNQVNFWISEIGTETDLNAEPPAGTIKYEFIYWDGQKTFLIGLLDISFVMKDGVWTNVGYQVQCKLDVLGTIKGRVVNAITGEPMPNAQVYAESKCGLRSPMGWLDGNGEFTVFGAVPGEITLHAISPYFEEAMVSGIQIETGQTVTLDQTIQMIPLVNMVATTVSGRITFRDGEKPFAGVNIFGEKYPTVVYLETGDSSDGGQGLPGTVDSEGRYQITFVGPGEYRLKFSSQGLSTFVDESGAVKDYFLVNVSETDGMVKELPDLKANNLPPQIDSITLSEEGQVAPGASVRIQVAAGDPDQALSYPNQDTLTYYWKAESGAISLTQGNMVDWTAPNAPGTYTIEVIVNDGKGGADSGSVQITVTEPR